MDRVREIKRHTPRDRIETQRDKERQRQRAREMSQGVKALVDELMISDLRTDIVEDELPSMSCLLTSTGAPWHMHPAHIYTMKSV